MRGQFQDQGGLFSYIDPETRISAKHPLRQIRELVREVLGELDAEFTRPYPRDGRPSIPPEMLLSALLLDHRALSWNRYCGSNLKHDDLDKQHRHVSFSGDC